MKAKHIIAGVSIVVILALGFVVYKAVNSLDKVILYAVNEYGPEIIGADVRLSDVQLDLSEGIASLNGLFVGNPEGFKTDYAMKLDQVKVSLDIDSLTSDTIVIKEVLIDGPAITYEMASGGSNIDTLSKNVSQYTGEASQEEETAGGTKLIIEDLYINNGDISVSHSILKGKTLSTVLPNVHLKDIGKDKGGASPGEVVKKVMGSITSGVGSAVGALKLDKIGGAVLEKGKEAGKALTEGLGGAGDKLKGLFK